MGKTVACRDLGTKCDFVAKAETYDELMVKVNDHAKDKHEFTDESLKAAGLDEKVLELTKNQ